MTLFESKAIPASANPTSPMLPMVTPRASNAAASRPRVAFGKPTLSFSFALMLFNHSGWENRWESQEEAAELRSKTPCQYPRDHNRSSMIP